MVETETSPAVLGTGHSGTGLQSKVVNSLVGDKEQTFRKTKRERYRKDTWTTLTWVQLYGTSHFPMILLVNLDCQGFQVTAPFHQACEDCLIPLHTAPYFQQATSSFHFIKKTQAIEEKF